MHLDSTEASKQGHSRVGMGRELATLQNINSLRKEKKERRTSNSLLLVHKSSQHTVIMYGERGENQ